MKQLIVNADDFGRAPGINRGILEAHRNGIVTSTTVMVNYPDAAPGLEQALTDAPALGIGLHFTLTSGKPVSAPEHVASLVNDEGYFYTINQWPQHYNDFDPDHLQREVAAQVERFIQFAGRPPDHLDAHHHATYLHPTTLEAMFEFSRGYNIPMRAARLNLPTEEAVKSIGGLLPVDDPAEILRILESTRAVVAAQPEPPFWPATFHSGFFDRTATLADLLLILTNLEDDSLTELMCHPGFIDEGFTSPYNVQREREIEALTHPATRECVQDESINLITFGDVPRP